MAPRFAPVPPGPKARDSLPLEKWSVSKTAGEKPKVVQERLGHASITITMDSYAHVTATMQRNAAYRFGALLGG